jgi:hypothetical protein
MKLRSWSRGLKCLGSPERLEAAISVSAAALFREIYQFEFYDA